MRDNSRETNIYEDFGSERLLFRQNTNECHLLNEHAAYVSKLVEKKQDRSAILTQFKSKYPELEDRAPQIVDTMMDFLQDAKPTTEETIEESFSDGRRRVLKVAGLALISTCFAPAPAAAQSCTMTSFTAVPAQQNNAGLTPALMPNPTAVSVCLNPGATAVEITSTSGGLVFDEAVTFTNTAGPSGVGNEISFTSFQDCTPGMTAIGIGNGTSTTQNISLIFGALTPGFYTIEISQCNSASPSSISPFTIDVT